MSYNGQYGTGLILMRATLRTAAAIDGSSASYPLATGLLHLAGYLHSFAAFLPCVPRAEVALGRMTLLPFRFQLRLRHSTSFVRL